MDRTAEYLLVLYAAERQRSPPIESGVVARALGRSPAATTEMLQRLADRELVVHEPYEGATLTEAGRETAADCYDRYVTLVRFLVEVLDVADPEAEALEMVGAVSTTVTDRLVATLLGEDGGSDREIDDRLLARTVESP